MASSWTCFSRVASEASVVNSHQDSTLAALSHNGVTYTNASTSTPSDSSPGSLLSSPAVLPSPRASGATSPTIAPSLLPQPPPLCPSPAAPCADRVCASVARKTDRRGRDTSLLPRASFQLFPAAARFARSTSITAAFFPSCRNCSAVVVANRCIPLATIPVHPVWWLAPRPAPLSP